MMEMVGLGDVTGSEAFGPGNPFFTESRLPFQAPAFDRIRDEDYLPAIEAGMAEQRREMRAIAEDPAPPTFENTLVAMERSGRLLSRVLAVFFGVAGSNLTPVMEAVRQEIAPRLAAHGDAILLDAELFARVEAVYGRREEMEGEARRLLEVTYLGFTHAGARLSDGDKERLKALNEEESTLRNEFLTRLLGATKEQAFHTLDRGALAGLTEAQIAGAEQAAKERGLEGYLIPLQNTTQQPALAALSVRETRRALFELSVGRTERGGANDTRGIVARLAQMRAEKAALLGAPSYAAWSLQDQMAKTPETALGFLAGRADRVRAAARWDAADLQAAIDAEGGGFALEPWDWEFYREKVRRERFSLDEAETKPYFELYRVLDEGLFYAASALYGISFQERRDLPVYHADVRVFEVLDEGGTTLALFYFDPYKRDTKNGGAWMGEFVGQSRLLGSIPVVYNVMNYAKPAGGDPALLSFDDVTTMFHEFGHALHGFFSRAMYPSLSGTAVARDFVEFPSQFNERWALEPSVFQRFARHYQTGEPMPAEMATKLRQIALSDDGYRQMEVLAAAQLDMEWHTMRAGSEMVEPSAFERDALERTGLAMREVPPRYRTSYFAHIWGGGYAAGYYAYLWSEALDERAYQWFEDHGGMTRENGRRLREMVLSRGNTEELAAMYERWIG